ncbi:MAG: hypothetical protein JO050_11525 [Acidimicrobiia bacterium]|nr:hypothetical protein [Acidimicrobiia bacterium]
MTLPQALNDIGARPGADPWSGWAQVVDLPAPEPEAPTEPEAAQPELEDSPPDRARDHIDAVDAVALLASALTDERRLRADAEMARREAEARLHAAEMEGARLRAEVSAMTARVSQLERDRDDVIARAEELLTAVRERADQRLASELEAARRQWSELLAGEQRRVETLDAERGTLAQRVEDAWLAAAVLRRARPLRPRSSSPTTVADAEQEMVDDLEEHEIDPVLAAESPELAGEIDALRQRLRARLHKPPEIDVVEDGVDQLREARLARDAAARSRRRK